MVNEHWFLFAGFLLVIGAQLQSTGEWADLTKPVWWATFLIQIGLFLRAAYVAPKDK